MKATGPTEILTLMICLNSLVPYTVKILLRPVVTIIIDNNDTVDIYTLPKHTPKTLPKKRYSIIRNNNYS